MPRTTATTDLSSFSREAAVHLDRLKQSGGVEILTVDGRAIGVVMAPHVYDEMLDKGERAEITREIRLGLADVEAGRVKPAKQVYDELIAKYGLDPAIVYGESAEDE